MSLISSIQMCSIFSLSYLYFLFNIKITYFFIIAQKISLLKLKLAYDII